MGAQYLGISGSSLSLRSFISGGAQSKGSCGLGSNYFESVVLAYLHWERGIVTSLRAVAQFG